MWLLSALLQLGSGQHKSRSWLRLSLLYILTVVCKRLLLNACAVGAG